MHPITKATIAILVLSICLFTVERTATPIVVAQQTDYAKLKSEAEQLYSAGSYARALELYSKIDKSKLAPAEVRWVEFRIADATWRSQAATETADTTKFEQAQKQLEELIRTSDKPEAGISFGPKLTSPSAISFGYVATKPTGTVPGHTINSRSIGGPDNVTSSQHVPGTGIVLDSANPPRADQYYYYTYYGNQLPLDVLENALKISHSENDKAQLHYLIAMTMRHQGGDWESRQQVPDEFEASLKTGPKTDWYDDALFHYAQWMESYGEIREVADNQWQQEPDYVKALELYRRLLREFTKGETRYHDQAQQQIRSITQPTINVAVAHIFLPKSELQFSLQARNVKRIDLAIYKVDLTRDVRFKANSDEEEGESDTGTPNWLQSIPLAGRIPVKRWSEDLKDQGQHKPIAKESRIEGQLPLGAYVLEASSGSLKARDLVLVSDASIVMKTSPKQALVYFSMPCAGLP